jgi:DNA-binding CsgD family transcriptional regulator
MPRGEDLLATIEAIHAAGLDPEQWPDALSRTTRLFGAVGATLENFDKRSLTLRDFKVVGLPDGAADPYVEYYARHNPRADYAFRHLSQQTLCDYQFIDERGMDRDPYYADYLTSIGLRYFLSGQICNTAQTQAVVAIQRSRRQGHVGEGDIDCLRRLLPHLRQAWDVTTRLKSAERAVSSFERALDWLADGVVLLRADGRVLYGNESFQAIARRSDGIRTRRGLIEIADVAGQAEFAAAIGAIQRSRRGGLDSGSGDIVVARRGGNPPYIVSVRPLARVAREQRESNADLIVFIHDPLQRDSANARVLRNVFGLTEAEAELARALQAGTTPGEYALARAVSLNTVYTHLRRIKEKTRCRRMAELIRKLNDLRLPARGV